MGMQLIENHVRRDRGLPDDFVFVRYEWLKDGSRVSMMRMDGGCCPLLMRGPRKGKPNYKKLTNEQTFYVTTSEIDELKRRYEIETGKCCACEGEGKTVTRVSVVDGTEYRTCVKCNGSGKAIV